jgi:hypothetical protein
MPVIMDKVDSAHSICEIFLPSFQTEHGIMLIKKTNHFV